MTRILHVVTHMNRGGLETMIMNYYRHIDREKVQFDFLTHRPYDGDYAEEILSLGGRIFHISRLNPFGEKYKKELGDFFDTHSEYKVIHVHQDCLSGVVLRVAKEHGIPARIAHSHSSSQDKDWKYMIKLLYRHMIPQYATDLFACSEVAGKWMFCGANFSVINNAINSKEYVYDTKRSAKIRQNLGIEPNELVLGHVGRFSAIKNHKFLIDVFFEVQKKMPAKLLLVGNDAAEDGSQIHDKVHLLGLDECVVFTGLRSDVADLMQAMDVFCLPSLYEGLPVSIIEAQAAGLPCIISDRVPLECKKTELVQQIPLKAGAELWAHRAIAATKFERYKTDEYIKKSGFDIVQNAKKLQEFYIEKSNY